LEESPPPIDKVSELSSFKRIQEDNMANRVFVLSAKRTPIGAFMGSLSTLSATELGAIAIKAAVESAGLNPEQVDEVIMGQVLTAGAGQAPARQSALGALLPHSASCTTVNKVCGSGLKAVMLGVDSLKLGNSSVVVAGGQESMSRAPHLLSDARGGVRLGPTQLQDAILVDGLVSPFDQKHMGLYAEMCVKEFKLSREAQDEFAKQSYLKAQRAQSAGHFQNEIVPVVLKSKKGDTQVAQDDEPGKALFDKMATLRPAFDKDGTITAANASKINDGAAALTLASEEFVQKNGLKPIAEIKAHATFAQSPEWFTTAPVGAIKKLLENQNLKKEDIDLYEINEAFSAVTMAAIKDLGLDESKVNVNGGAVALGHPIGASGARILTTLVHALKNQNKKRGIAAICLGGGEAVAVLVEAV
jgi:acetyl-CoA C-acetyltransferase